MFLTSVASLAGIGVWTVFPDTVLVFNDDFGYLRSILATIQHGRPWTDDWLEPWAASLSVISAVLFKATGSFRVATQGVQAAMVAASFFAVGLLLVRRGLPFAAAVAVAAVGLTFPTVLFKSLEFGAIVVSLPCLLFAVLFAEQKRWAWYSVVWVTAVTTRQSAIAWLVLPAIAAGTAWVREGRSLARTVSGPAVVVFAGILVYLAMDRWMNVTHAQVVMTGGMWRNLRLAGFARSFALAAAVWVAGVGVGGFLVRTFAPGRGVAPPERGCSWPLRIFAIVALGGLLVLIPRTPLKFEHRLFDEPNGAAYLGIIVGLSGVGWLLGGFRWRRDLVGATVACALLVGLRETIWDYYLLDVAILAMLSAVRAEASAARMAPVSGGRKAAWWAVGGVALATLAWFHVGFLRTTKRTLDLHYAAIALCEQALRAGRIGPSELAPAPFGLIGWHLFPYFVRHEGAEGGLISNFGMYVAWNALSLEIVEPVATMQLTGAAVELPADSVDGTIARGVFPLGWNHTSSFRLYRRDSPQPPAMKIDPASYRLEPFPLNDTEWRQLLDSPRR